jgi:hypothetical protein
MRASCPIVRMPRRAPRRRRGRHLARIRYINRDDVREFPVPLGPNEQTNLIGTGRDDEIVIGEAVEPPQQHTEVNVEPAADQPEQFLADEPDLLWWYEPEGCEWNPLGESTAPDEWISSPEANPFREWNPQFDAWLHEDGL